MYRPRGDALNNDEFDMDNTIDPMDPMTSFLRGIYMQQIGIVSTQRQSTEAFNRIATALEEIDTSLKILSSAAADAGELWASMHPEADANLQKLIICV